MKKIINPWLGIEGYNCFGCAPHNPSGLQMEFYVDGDDLVSIWNPKDHFQSWQNVLHGGIQSAIVDEMAEWVVHYHMKATCVTSKLEMKFLKSVATNDGALTIRGKLSKLMRNVGVVDVTISNAQGEVCTQGTVYMFSFKNTENTKVIYRDLELEEGKD